MIPSFSALLLPNNRQYSESYQSFGPLQTTVASNLSLASCAPGFQRPSDNYQRAICQLVSPSKYMKSQKQCSCKQLKDQDKELYVDYQGFLVQPDENGLYLVTCMLRIMDMTQQDMNNDT